MGVSHKSVRVGLGRVNVDVDVPLFLPLYGERRLHDLLLLAHDEDRLGTQLAGVLNFDSGWEWGYWLNDVILAAAAWDPHQFTTAQGQGEEGQGNRAFQQALERVFRHVEPETIRRRVVDWLVRLTQQQHELLILGASQSRPIVKKRRMGSMS